MCAAEVCGGAGAARPDGAALPLRGSVALSDKEVDAICWLVGHVTEVRKGIEAVSYYAARDYVEEIEGRRFALESALELGKFGIASYLERCGKRPDSVKAKENRYGLEAAFSGKIRFYIKLGEVVHVFEEAGDRRGRYLGEFTTKELEESGI